MTKLITQEELDPAGYECGPNGLRPVAIIPAFNCNDLSNCDVNALGNVVAPAPLAGQVLLSDGTNWIASNILTGSGGGIYPKDFLIADWTGSPLTITILATEHGLGITKNLDVSIYLDSGTDNENVITDWSVSDTGDVTIETNTAFNGNLIIMGGGAGIVNNKMTHPVTAPLGFTYGTYTGITLNGDSALETSVESVFNVLETVTVASIRVIYEDNTGISTIDGDSVITLRKNNADTGIAISIPQPTNTGTKLQAGSNIGTEVFTTTDKMSFSLTGAATTGDVYIRALIIDYII